MDAEGEPVLPEIISETIVEYLHEVEGESPIDLCWENFIKIRAVPIEYENYNEVPTSLTLKNTAYNIVLSGVWPEGKKPLVSKGPLATKYDFAQAHFHWGIDNQGGSDHDVEGASLPFEIHLVFFKSSSGTIEEAKKEEDGIVVFCYLYKLQDIDDPEIKPITDNIKEVTYAYSKKELTPVPLSTLFGPITEDYIAYLGFMKYKAVHGVTYIISREMRFLSEAQLSVFRELKDRHENPMILKKREVQNFNSRNVFVVNPNSAMLTTVLHAISKRSKQSDKVSHAGSSKRSQKGSSPAKKKSSAFKKSPSKKSSRNSKKKSSSKKGKKSKKSRKGSKKGSKKGSRKSKKGKKNSKKRAKSKK
ncbi:hypothetical protein GE061_007833 [Apolygus lucorum]|uniref:Alpha-carbonic anhydrase domain-containing protein n=1 Tax=Apolygus lucorum TaxID=248454 RepID=A0A8S9WQK5_APOLU|nr:hypothetical protein GE061_007833 [Apolygus lucorum]